MKEKNCYRSNEASLCFGEENLELFSWKEKKCLLVEKQKNMDLKNR